MLSLWRILGLLTLTLWMLLPAGISAQETTSAVGPVMKLFQSGRLPPERHPPVVEMICNRGNEHDLRVIFDRVIKDGGFTPELRVKALVWLTDAAVTRKVQPSGDLGGLAALVVGARAAADPALQRSAIRLAAVWKVAAVAPALRELALDPQTPLALQKSAIDGLIVISDPASREALKSLSEPGRPLAVRMQAIAGIAGFDASAAASFAAVVLRDAAPRDNPGPMLDAFFQQKDGADQLAAALSKSPPTGDVAKVALRYMYSVGRSDASLSTILGNAAGIAADPPPPTPEEIAHLVGDVIAKGDPVRGEAIFRRKDLSCMKCHSVSRAGGQVGPELSAVGGSSPPDYIVNSILNPNAAVKEQYVTKVFELSSGKVLTGVVIDRDDVRVNVRDVNGQTVVIPVADIEDEAEGKSLMPQGLTKFLTREELVDLARFVSELGKPGPYAVNTARTIQRWRWLQNPPPELITSVPHLEHVREHILGAEPSAWSAVYSRVAGTLPLNELREGTQPAVVILQGEFEQRTAGTVTVKITSTEPLQSWVDAEAFEGRSEYTVSLPPGRHAVTLRVAISDREHPELRIELLTPADSSAKFEVVGGS